MCKLFQMVKLPTIHIGKLSLLLSILVWLSLLFVDLVRLFGIVNDLDSGIPEEITWILEIIFSSLFMASILTRFRPTVRMIS